jgi:phosphomannomutase
VGQSPITPDFILRLAHAVGRVLKAQEAHPTVLIGKDTRISGYMLESALESGFNSAGVDVVLLGPVPTPAVAYLTRAQRASLGVVISASHNPFADNGIKFFSAQGKKLSDAWEEAVEATLLGFFCPWEDPTPGRCGRQIHRILQEYFFERLDPQRLENRRRRCARCGLPNCPQSFS